MNPTSASKKQTPDFSDPELWERLCACPLCGSTSLDRVVVAKDRHYANPGAFPVFECGSCSVWFLNPMPTISYLSHAYPENYYSYETPSPVTGYKQPIFAVKSLVRRAIGFNPGKTGDPEFSEPGTVLDLGCGAGAFLIAMRQKGWKVHGAELDSKAAQRGQQAGIDIFAGTIDAAGFDSEMFDYVRSNHSFEHLHNPREVLSEIHRILKPNGLLFIGVPNVRGLASKIFGTYWWYLGAPVHTFGYSPSSLKHLLIEANFEIRQVKCNSTFPGIFGSLQIYWNRGNGRNSEDGWIFQNRVLRVFGHWLARFSDLFHSGDCIEVIAQPKKGTVQAD